MSLFWIIFLSVIGLIELYIELIYVYLVFTQESEEVRVSRIWGERIFIMVIGLIPILNIWVLWSDSIISIITQEIYGKLSFKIRRGIGKIIRDRHYKVDRDLILTLDPFDEEDWKE